MSEQAAPQYAPQTWPHADGAFNTDLTAPRKKRFTLKMGIAAGVAVVALVGGIGIGQATAPPRKECAQAFTYSEKSMQDASDGLTAISNAMGGGVYAMLGLSTKLDPLTADIKKNTPLYNDAKAACIK